MKFLTAYITDKGETRDKNQDALAIQVIRTGKQRILMAVICDGVGGLKYGELASAHVVRNISRWFQQNWKELGGLQYGSGKIKKTLQQWIEQEHRQMTAYGKQSGFLLGTTMSLLVIINHRYYIMHVGDTRVYYGRHSLRQITADHCLQGNVLLQCIGAAKQLKADFYYGKVRNNSVFLLCSDGFYKCITREELDRSCFLQGMIKESQIVHRLWELCRTNRMRGQQDNLSAIYIKVR